MWRVIFLLDWCLEEPVLWKAAQNPQLYMKDSTHISVSSFFWYWIRCTFRVMENGQPGCNVFVLNKGVAVFWAVGTQNTSEEKWGFCFCFSLVLLEHMHVCACVCVWVWVRVLYHNLMYLCGGSPSLFSALTLNHDGKPRVPTRGDKGSLTKRIIENGHSGRKRAHFWKKKKLIVIQIHNHYPQREKER